MLTSSHRVPPLQYGCPPDRCSSCYGPRNLAQGKSYGWATYIAMVLCAASVEDLWTLVSLPPFFCLWLLSPLHAQLCSNVSLGLPFLDLVTTHRKLEGTWSKEKIHCFTINISSFSPCVKSYIMTMGDFHGNLTDAAMLDLVLLVPINYKHPLVPPAISRPPCLNVQWYPDCPLT